MRIVICGTMTHESRRSHREIDDWEQEAPTSVGLSLLQMFILLNVHEEFATQSQKKSGVISSELESKRLVSIDPFKGR